MTRQRGFTLIELMFAAAATAVVIWAATGFLLKALSWYGELSAKIAINRHARETFDVLAYGGRSASTGNDGTMNVYGIRGRHQAPGSGMRNNYALRYSSNNLTLTPDLAAPMTIACIAATNPMPDCGVGSQTVNGWLGSDIQLNTASRSVVNKTAEVTMTVMDPYEIQRAKNPATFADTYRTIFTLNRNENDP